MIRGVRDKSALSAMGLSKRLLVRLGVLISRGLACSEALLETAGRGTPAEKLLLSEGLLAAAAELDTERLRGLAAEAGVAEGLAVVGEGDRRTLALEEEIEAEKAWAETGSGGEADLVKLAQAPALAAGGSGMDAAAAEIFSPAEIERLKLTALTSARAEEAISAMRRLAYAPLPPRERGEVFVRALTSLDPQVRAEAARLLAGVGLKAEISEALVALSVGKEAERRLATDRLGRALAERGSQAGEADLLLVSSLVALTSALASEPSARIRGHILSSLGGAAGVLASFPERLAEVVRHVVELLVGDYAEASQGAGDLFDAVIPVAGAALRPLLRAELDKTRDPRVRAFLLGQLAPLPEGPEAQEICDLLAGEVATGEQDASDQQMLAGRLFALPAEPAARAILERFPAARPGAKRYFLRLLADLCRYREVGAEIVERCGELFLSCLQGATKDLRLGVLETLLPADPRLSAGLRGRLAEAYIESFSDLVFKADIELAESTLANMGGPALPVMLDRLGPSWPPEDRVRACRVVGEMGRLAAGGAMSEAGIAEGLRQAERRLLQLATAEFTDPGALAVSMGKVAAAIDHDLAALQTVWRRVEDMKIAEHCRLEALSWVASGRAATADMIEAAAAGLLRELTAPEPDSLGELTESRAGTERTLEVSPAASDFVNSMPAVVRGLARVASSETASGPLRSRVLTALINRWRDLVSGKRIWGPAAATTVIEGLRDLACHPSARPAEKLEVIRALGLRLADPPAMRAIALVLVTDGDSPQLAGPASSAALALLGLRDARGRIPEEDREHILWCLAAVLRRKTLETSSPRTAKLRERMLEELYEGLNDGVPGVYEALAELAAAGALPEGLSRELSERLAARRALTVLGDGARS
jgi:hypothetical protein